MTVILVGESNPYGADPRHALYPYPPRCAGWRLCYKILQMSEEEYLAAFERRNLLTADRWSVVKAREAANKLRGEVRDGARLVLLGAKVAQAFGYTYEPFEERRGLVHGEVVYSVLMVPHPSGLSRAWHDSTMAPRTRIAIKAFAGLA